MLDLKKIRRDLHKIPELGYEEVKTQKYILSVLQNYKELKIHTFDFTGILVEYSKGSGDYQLFRADMDALAVHEKTGCDFQSTHPGKMHACGHDVHMAVLLGFIEQVVQNKLQQNLLFLFQPAEEGKGGALRIIKTGILDNFHISAAYALHVKGDLPVGTIGCKPGIFFAHTQEVDVSFKGVSAHVAFPQNGINALQAGAYFYTLMDKQIASYKGAGRVICDFGRMEAGTVRNAVAANCVFEGTMRALVKTDRDAMEQIIINIAKDMETKYRVSSKVTFSNQYASVENDERLYLNVKAAVANRGYKFVEAQSTMGGEDFGYLAHRHTGVLFLLGVNQGSDEDLHSTKFLPNEEALKIGVDIFWELVK